MIDVLGQCCLGENSAEEEGGGGSELRFLFFLPEGTPFLCLIQREAKLILNHHVWGQSSDLDACPCGHPLTFFDPAHGSQRVNRLSLEHSSNLPFHIGDSDIHHIHPNLAMWRLSP